MDPCALLRSLAMSARGEPRAPAEVHVMQDRPFQHLGSAAVLASLVKSVEAERKSTAELLACIAEFEARDLHRKDGFDSIEAFCIEKCNWDEDELPMRILVARTGRKFPELFDALALGALHLET